MVPNILSIAGSDPSGGAGAQADIKSISACGCYALAVITTLTAQNTRGVSSVHALPAGFVAAQIDAIFADVRVDAVKIGMLGAAEIAEVVADRLRKLRPRFVVLDPVLASSSGESFSGPELLQTLREKLLPLATLTTPNLPEATRLVGEPDCAGDDAEIERLAGRLRALGARAVLMKGGHRSGAQAIDVLFSDAAPRVYAAPRVATSNTHGTGCALSSSIAAGLALGLPLEDAVGEAKRYVTGALLGAGRLSVGGGHGPLDHFWRDYAGDGKAPRALSRD
ncbi:MAG TPA: bifunctional hydroxymethylpyrimidine kinase/phosphomethylpyrimidine kinase [Beijerinckiaceae bacterium]|nr:bifunctional hydroxymethylpyrimidine kinase/phosphomethylpyrimidine kinase [Beijerinckiaceae bacterium]HVB90368.1 bifunctional hydroxymethylpyrimidine kinase/phosphomethylpyrimidine kinase [Beijerinckiaceae bacterium]